MAVLLPLASGKGGVGKTLVAANLGIALAEAGRTVILADVDLGGANLHTCLGIKNPHRGLGSLIWKRERHLSELLLETGMDRLWLIPGDGLYPGTPNLEWGLKRKILKELAALPADFVILDLGAGSSYGVVDFFVASEEGLLVIRPEITSVLNAYSFLKTAAYRLISRTLAENLPKKGAEPGGESVGEALESLTLYVRSKVEGSGKSFIALAEELAESYPRAGGKALARLSGLRPLVVMNQCRSPDDGVLARRFEEIALRNLGMRPRFLSVLPDDESVPRSVATRRPVMLAEPESGFGRGAAALARRLGAAYAEGWPGGPDRHVEIPEPGLAALLAECFS